MSASKCPFCKLSVDRSATRCPHCTSDLSNAGLNKATFLEKLLGCVCVLLVGYFLGGVKGVGISLCVFGVLWFILSFNENYSDYVVENKKKDAEKALERQRQSDSIESTHVRCSACQEFVLPLATRCKHCGSDIEPDYEFELRKLEPEDQMNPIEAWYERHKYNYFLHLLGAIAFLIIFILILAHK
jgi:hypothetical protein